MINTILKKAKLLYILIFPFLYIFLLVAFRNTKKDILFKNVNYSVILLIFFTIVGILFYAWNKIMCALTKKYQVITIVYMLCFIGGIVFSLYYLPSIYKGNLTIYYALIDNLNYLYILLGNVVGLIVNLITVRH